MVQFFLWTTLKLVFSKHLSDLKSRFLIQVLLENKIPQRNCSRAEFLVQCTNHNVKNYVWTNSPLQNINNTEDHEYNTDKLYSTVGYCSSPIILSTGSNAIVAGNYFFFLFTSVYLLSRTTTLGPLFLTKETCWSQMLTTAPCFTQ